MLEALVPAVLEQKVQIVTAHHAWRWLLARHGTPAPGPAPEGMRVVPDARTWAAIPTWDWHRAGVDPRRARTVIECARVARRLEECSAMEPVAAQARLQLVPGVGCGRPPRSRSGPRRRGRGVGRGLPPGQGRRVGARRRADRRRRHAPAARPYAPHRYRVVRLLEVSGLGLAPRRVRDCRSRTTGELSGSGLRRTCGWRPTTMR
ncbi:hypothetical protein NKG05_10410 [Oerskovia sp. M15]